MNSPQNSHNQRRLSPPWYKTSTLFLLLAFSVTALAIKPDGRLFPYNEFGLSAAEDHFGQSVTIEGDFMVVGAPQAELGYAFGYTIGVAHVYQRVNNQWTPFQTLTLPTDLPYTLNFAHKVLLADGKLYIAVNGQNFFTNRQAAILIYHLVNGQWTYQTSIEQPNVDDNETFATDFSVDQNTLVVSNIETTVNGEHHAGSAYIYEFNNATQTWQFVTEINAPTPAANDYFGSEVKIEGDRIVVSTIKHPFVIDKRWVFERENGVWSAGQEFPFQPHQGVTVGSFDLDQNTLLALTDTGPGIYVYHNGDWQLSQQLTHPTMDLSQPLHAYMKNGTLVLTVAGAQYHAVVYRWDGNQWQYYDDFTDPLASLSDGFSVAHGSGSLVFGEYRPWDGNEVLRGRIHVLEDNGVAFDDGTVLMPELGGFLDQLGSKVWLDGDTALVQHNNGIHEFSRSQGQWSHVMNIEMRVNDAVFNNGYLLVTYSGAQSDIFTLKKINNQWAVINQPVDFLNGESFAFKDNRLVVHKDPLNTIELYALINEEWVFDKQLALPEPLDFLQFDMNSSHLLVGVGNGGNIAHLFNMDSGQLVQSISAEVPLSNFASAVALHDSEAIIADSVPHRPVEGSTVHRYSLMNDALTFVEMIPVNPVFSGIRNLQMNGEYLLIHSDWDQPGPGVDSYYQIYKLDNGDWLQHTSMFNRTSIRFNNARSALSGDKLLIGQYLDGDHMPQSGKAEVYDVSFSDLIFEDGLE